MEKRIKCTIPKIVLIQLAILAYITWRMFRWIHCFVFVRHSGINRPGI